MFARIELAQKPELSDPQAQAFLRKLSLALPEVRAKIRWLRVIDVFWLDLPLTREELIPAMAEVFWDRVTSWILSGNLIPSGAAKHGGVLDLMESAPYRPGRFWGLEKRLRSGVTDNVGRTTLEAFEIVSHRKLVDARAASGAMILFEGPTLTEADLALISRSVFCNELVETWTLLSEAELVKSDRFHPERVKREMPKVGTSNRTARSTTSVFALDRPAFGTPSDFLRPSDLPAGAERTLSAVERIQLQGKSSDELVELSRNRLWALNAQEMLKIQSEFGSREITDVEIEVLAQTWSEHCKHKIFGADIQYREVHGAMATIDGERIPAQISSLFKTTIAQTTQALPRPWLLSVFSDNAGIVAFDAEDAVCIKVETHNSPSALDPYGGALTGIVGVNRDILGCGLGARPIANTDVFCVASPETSGELPERLMHPRRILDGIRRGVEHGGNKSGIPTVNGALVFDQRYLGKPLVYCGTIGVLPRMIAGRPCETKEILPGDRIVMAGGRIGKDGIHGATFSSLALDESSPTSAVQLGDPITQKRMIDFLLEARDLGLYRAVTDNGAGGLSSSVGEMAQLSGGARLDVTHAPVKYPGLKPFERVISESQERMTLAVADEKWEQFSQLASRRGVEVSSLGKFTDSGRLEILCDGETVADLSLEFLHKGCPTLSIQAEWSKKIPTVVRRGGVTFAENATGTLLGLLGQPNIASKEWLIRQYDHEVQGSSVIKPMHTVGVGGSDPISGPNDGGVILPRLDSEAGLAVGCGILPRYSDWDAYLMALMSVDEAVRNVLCVGGDYGSLESVIALVDNFCWPDPVSNPGYAADLVRACFGLRKAALELAIPLVSGKDSMKNDYRGKQNGQPVQISVPPTLLMTAMAKVSDLKRCRTADFKAPGDLIYLLGGKGLGLLGSELQSYWNGQVPVSIARLPEPRWSEARKLYSWIGGSVGKEHSKLRSLHDVSDGGVAVAVAEGCIARGLGAQLVTEIEPWEAYFAEGFHTFVATVSEPDALILEQEWVASGIPFKRMGRVMSSGRLDFVWNEINSSNTPEQKMATVSVAELRQAWQKEGYWE
jgi:phosphoribosylformylglycinamidine synthase II